MTDDTDAQLPDSVSAERTAQPVDAEAPPRLAFPVVGVGASAGGLEAYTEFLRGCSSNSGMAFVLIQHLSPRHESVMAELLAKHTSMPVLQVTDSMPAQANHVYVIRPGYTMTISDGRLHLGASAAEPGHRRPIDDFFRSLAEEQRYRTVCVILSGTGSNGTAGAQTVKAVGGICIAQEPETAKFPAMPRSLIDSGMADMILPPREMFAAIARFVSHPYNTDKKAARRSGTQDSQAMNEIIAVLRTRVRHDFSGYKKPTLLRRIQRRMSLLQLRSMSEYAKTLRQSPAEITALSDDMLIHVTGFFRDPESWEAFRQRVVDPLVRQKEDGETLRGWVTACSSGEEAYTLGILLLEAAEASNKRLDIKVFATDAAERSLSQARAGVFPGGIESEVTPQRLERFFEKDDSFYRVKKELRELVVFAPQNLLQDPPFSRLDICTCRNLLIYIEPEVQQRILALLHFGLREGGALLLGTSETINGADELFEAIDKKHRIFRRVGPTRHGSINFPASQDLASLIQRRQGEGNNDDLAKSLPQGALAQLTAKLLLDKFTPAAVVVDRQGQIVYYHGATEQYLIQPRGGPTRELLMLVREEMRGTVRATLQRAKSQNETAESKDGTLGEGAGRVRLYVHVVPLEPRVTTAYFLVGFERRSDPPPLPASDGAAGAQKQSDELAEELGRVRDELQSTAEELQTSNEEMKASHEEVTSINEELQSSNEELETSKEELQSLNEELTTVNAQLQAKMEEVERARNDLASLLSSTNIAVIFLDRQFRIRSFTPAVRDLLELISSDVGRPLSDLARKFTDPDLLADADGVLSRLVPSEREISAEGERTYLRRVTPYRTANDRIDGVVVTFIDVTALKTAQAAVQASEEKYRSLFSSMDEGYCIIEMIADASGAFVDWRFIEVNPAFEKNNGLANATGRTIREMAPDIEQKWFDIYGKVVQTGEPLRFTEGSAALGRYFDLYACRVGSPAQRRVAVLFTDITERKRIEERQAFLLKLSDALRPLADPEQIRFISAQMLGQHLGASRVAYAEDGGDGKTFVVTRNYVKGANEVVGRYNYSDYGPDILASLQSGQVRVQPDIRGDPRLSDDQKRALAEAAVAASLNEPLVKNGRLVAFLGVDYSAPHEFGPEEIELSREVAERTWAAVERAKAEAALAASEEKYHTLFDSIDEGVATMELILDDEGRATDWIYLEHNPALARLTGLTQNIVGKKASDIYQNLEPFWVETFERVVREGTPRRFEYRVPDLGNRWFDVYAARVGGAGSRQLAIVYNNITDRKRREADLAFLAEISQDLVPLTNIDDTMNVLGAKIGGHFRLSHCLFVEWNEGSGTSTVNYGWHRSDVPEVRGAYRIRDFLGAEFAERSMRGEAIVVNDTARDPLTDAEQFARLGICSFVTVPLVWAGELRFWIGIYDSVPRVWRDDEIELMRELTARIWTRLEHARADEAMRVAREVSEHAGRMKDELLATLSHELRTPLSSILLWSKILQPDNSLANLPQLREGLAAIELGAQSQKRLLDDMIDATRIASGKFRLNFRDIDFAQVIRDALDAIKPTADAKGVKLISAFGDDLGRVRADPDRVGQIVWNLLSNAVKFTPAKGRIDVGVRRFDGSVEIRVEDNGCGIPADFLPRIFDRFSQAQSGAAGGGGIGLGLAITRQLVELHGGTIEAHSDGAGMGSVFTVRIPLPKSSAAKPKRRSNLEARMLQGVRVLLVEDDAAAQLATQTLLAGAGATVIVAATANDAVKAYTASQPDVILTDIGLPGEDGYSLLQRIREIESKGKLSPVPAVALSALARDKDQKRGKAAGFAHYLAKPTEPGEILSALSALIPAARAKSKRRSRGRRE